MTEKSRRLASVLAGCLLATSTLATAQAGKPALKPPTGGYAVYVTNDDAGTLSIIDGKAMKVVATIELGMRARSIEASADGALLYVALSGPRIAGTDADPATLPGAPADVGGIAVIDVASHRLLRVLRGVARPGALAVGRDGRRLYVVSEATDAVVILDTHSGAALASVEVGAAPLSIGISPDGSVVYATSESDHTVTAIDTGSNTAIKRFEVGRRPRAIGFSSDGAQAFVTSEDDASLTVIDVQRHAAIERIALGIPGLQPSGVVALPPCGSVLKALPGPVAVSGSGVLISPDCGAILVTTGRGRSVLRIDAATRAVTSQASAGAQAQGIGLSPDGRYAFVANNSSGDVSVIDTRSMRSVGRIEVGGRPWGVAILPGTQNTSMAQAN